MRQPRGFTLLETVVALAILGLALMAIFDLNAGAVANHTYTKKLTVASFLARSKMTDLEQRLLAEGFSADDEEESGDFSDEGWSAFRWRATIIAPRTEGVTPEQVVSAIFNVPVAGEGGLAAMLATLMPSAAGAGALAAAALPGVLQTQFNQMVDTLTKAVREVHLTVSWREGTQVESLDLVTHVVALEPGADRNGTGPAPTLASGPGAAQQWVPATSVTANPPCTPVVPAGNLIDGAGGKRDRANPSVQLVPLATCLQSVPGRAGPGGVLPGQPGGSVR